MKKLLLLLTISFSFFTFSFSQEYGWKLIDPELIPETPDFSDVHFISADTGWFAITGPFYLKQVYRTDDGGASFTIQNTPFNTLSIHMIDKYVGYAVGFSGHPLKTVTGGSEWNAMETTSGSDKLHDISFPVGSDPENPVGYTSGDIFIYRVDTVVTYMGTPYAGIFSVCAISENDLWICGGSKILYYSNNSFDEKLSPSGSYNDLYFINDLTGWVVGDAGLILYTNDGGSSWDIQNNPSYGRSLRSVFFLNQNEGWVVGEKGIILHTTNGGSEWIAEATGLTNEWLRGVYFTSSSNGYVVGPNETLLKYTEISGIVDGVEILPIEIFPNPAKDKFTVQSLKFKVEDTKIELFDVSGRKYLEQFIPKGTITTEVNVCSLGSGVYFCRLTINDQIITKKIIKQ